MSFSSDCSSSSSESESDTSVIEEVVGEVAEFAPYDDSLEPLATEEEAAEYEARVREEEEEEEQFQRRYSQELAINEWCSCSNCSVELVTKAQECICCREIDRCDDVMENATGDGTKCITSHPGFESVCLNRYVLEIAALGLKTRGGKSYTTLYAQGNRSEDQFLRSVAYRQFTRLLWDYLGSSKRYPLPCCAYNKIRKEFPSQNGQFHGFEEDED